MSRPNYPFDGPTKSSGPIIEGLYMALHHAAPGEIVDLSPLGAALADGQTSALVKTDSFEAMRLILPAGKTIPDHHFAGNVMIHCLEGTISLSPAEVELNANDWTWLERGAQHSVQAVTDASLLLTILFKHD